MKILILHTHYRQPGGEDHVFAAEPALLRKKGHEAQTVAFHNQDLEVMPSWKQAKNAMWNRTAHLQVRESIKRYRPHLLHIHNTFPLASPAIIHAAKAEKTPVVLTLHNYRLICPGSLLMRSGQLCEECIGRTIPWPGVIHKCWRGSKTHTAVVATMLATQRFLKTWSEQVDLYIALSEFSRKKFIQGGIPVDKIVVKPNFVNDSTLSEATGVTTHGLQNTFLSSENTPYALFVGRLSPEKGIQTLLRAWRTLPEIELIVAGDGPLLGETERFIHRYNTKNILLLGRQPQADVLRLMHGARLLVCPSECYENFPMTIAEAFASSLPVIASRLGAMAEIVEDGRTGLLFEPGNAQDLANKVAWAWAHPEEMAEMGNEARREYEAKYTAEKNYGRLMEIYERAIANHGRRSWK
jgi:glycosyltransferase involved in cell wall biosynthesis